MLSESSPVLVKTKVIFIGKLNTLDITMIYFIIPLVLSIKCSSVPDVTHNLFPEFSTIAAIKALLIDFLKINSAQILVLLTIKHLYYITLC